MPAATYSVEFDDELGDAIQAAVARGSHDTPGEVIKEAVWEWLLARAANARTHGEVEVLLEEAYRDLELNGAKRLTDADFDEIKRRGRERLAARRAAE